MAGAIKPSDDDTDDVKPIDATESSESKKKKLIIIIAAAILLLGGGGVAAYLTGMLDSVLGKEKTSEAEHKEGEHAEGEAKGEKGAGNEHQETPEELAAITFLEIKNLTVNLNTDDGSSKFLRLSVQLELANAEDKAKVEAVLPRVVDQFQTYLRGLRVQDLRGSKGMYRLQIELLKRVNEAAAPVKVRDVLFQELIIN
jgi:flagellar protein FliL